MKIENVDSAAPRVPPVGVCRPQWIAGARPCAGSGVAHIILAVTGEDWPTLTSCRRLNQTVPPAVQP